MIREIIRPKDSNLTIKIPQEYIGKEIEYIIFPIKDNNKIEEKKNFDISSLGGSLNQYADPNKMKLEESAWEIRLQS